MKLYQTIDWYNKHADHYLQQTSLYQPKAQLNDFVKLLDKGERVLDAGCGPGRDSNLLKEKGLKVTGIDLSHELIERAKALFKEIKFIEGSFLSLPFPNRSFKGIWAHASLVHLETIEDTQQAINEFARVLSPSGVLHIQVKTQLGKKKYITLTDNKTNGLRFFQLYTQSEIKELTNKAGFKTLKLYQYVDKNSNKKYKGPPEWMVYLGQKT